MNRYALSIGSNLGDRLANLRIAYLGLEGLGQPVAVSGLYETTPVGGPTQDNFLNAVVVLDTSLQPAELLTRCQAIEATAGRERVESWGPRTLDIDIVVFDGDWEDTAQLRVPHPRAAEREFVLRPLVEVWPQARLTDGIIAREALSVIEPQGVELVDRRWVDARSVGTWLVIAQLSLIGAIGVALVIDGSLDLLDHPFEALTGAVLLVFGLFLGLASSRALGSALSAHPEPRLGSRLVDAGPYQVIRHPMYASVLLIIIGAALLAGSRLALAGSLILLVLFMVKSGYEERRLRIHYPGYAEYRRRVRHRFIPGVF